MIYPKSHKTLIGIYSIGKSRLLKYLYIITISLLAPAVHAMPSAMPTTALHQALTSQTGWLNTSRALTAEDLRGRIILLDFWTFCCINCIHVMPDLKYLEDKFGDRLTVIGVHSAKFKNEQDSENIRQAILRHDLHHPVVNDFDFRIWKTFGVRSWPTFILINPDGRIEETYSGEGNRNAIEADIARLMDKYKGHINATALPMALEKDKQPRAYLHFPGKLAYAPEWKGAPVLFVSDSGNHRIVMMRLDGKVEAVIGSGMPGRKDGDFATAQFHTPQGMAWKSGVLYVADTENHLLRAVDFAAQRVTTLAGTGAQGYERTAKNADALTTPLASPWDVAFYPDMDHLAVAMAGTHQLWSYDLLRKTVSVLAGNGRESIDDGVYPYNSLSQPSGVSVTGERLYFVDSETSSLRVLEKGKIVTLIGTGLFDFGLKDGTRKDALMQHPLGLAADENTVYVADSYNHAIRAYDAAKATLVTIAGNGQRGDADGAKAQARFNEPNAVLKQGDLVYVADTNNHRLRVLDLKTHTVRTLPVSPMVNAEEDAPSFSATLPNARVLAPMDVAAGTSLAVQLTLKDGWKINHEAPSELALFREDAAHTPVAHLTRAQLEPKRAELPALAAGTYRLQGTLYYCEAKEGAQCMVMSVDGTVTAGAGGSMITLPIQ